MATFKLVKSGVKGASYRQVGINANLFFSSKLFGGAAPPATIDIAGDGLAVPDPDAVAKAEARATKRADREAKAGERSAARAERATKRIEKLKAQMAKAEAEVAKLTPKPEGTEQPFEAK